MSANPVHTMLLLGLGLRHLSVPPGAIPELKSIIRAVTLGQCRDAADRVMQMENPREIMDYLTQIMPRVSLDASPVVEAAISGERQP
jgi:phosphotransferase system enzyme I (PtsI)